VLVLVLVVLLLLFLVRRQRRNHQRELLLPAFFHHVAGLEVGAVAAVARRQLRSVEVRGEGLGPGATGGVGGGAAFDTREFTL